MHLIGTIYYQILGVLPPSLAGELPMKSVLLGVFHGSGGGSPKISSLEVGIRAILCTFHSIFSATGENVDSRFIIASSTFLLNPRMIGGGVMENIGAVGPRVRRRGWRSSVVLGLLLKGPFN